ncbi:MAG: carbon monoxide dehydrogenase subunit G [Bryobacteraceae bacterium]
MKVGGSYIIPVEPGRAYTLLQDPDILARCMPGCEQLARIGEDEYEMKMKMVISSVQGLFAGKVRLTDQNPPDNFRLLVEGRGKVGFMKGEGLLALAAAQMGDNLETISGTEVRYDGEVNVGGMMAGVGQRLLDVTAKLVIRKFFEKLVVAIAERDAPVPPEEIAE